MTVNENGLPEYQGSPENSLNPRDFVWNTGIPAKGSGFAFERIRVPDRDGGTRQGMPLRIHHNIVLFFFKLLV